MKYRLFSAYLAVWPYGVHRQIASSPLKRQGSAWVVGASRGQGASGPSLPVLAASGGAIQAQTSAARGGLAWATSKALPTRTHPSQTTAQSCRQKRK
jgi:hypothetical protein